MSGSYAIKIDKANKFIDMEVRGTFTPQQAQDFHAEYQKKVKSIDANNFTLIVDCLDMKIITQDMIEKLQFSFEMYRDSGFKEVQFIIKKNITMKMQLNRVSRNAKLTNARVVEVD